MFILELTKDSDYLTTRSKYQYVVDTGEEIGSLDDGPIYKLGNRLAYNGLMFRIPSHIKYDNVLVYYEIGSDVPLIEFIKEE